MEDSYEGIERELLGLRIFLQSAPAQFGEKESIRRHRLPNAEIVSCVRWEEDFFISGTDILRVIVYRFQAFGREVVNRTKFEEFVFSDLRSLKTNVSAKLEPGRSELLEFLHRNGCVRTKKKQRVFYWNAVPHDLLFLDTLERELRRTIIDDANNETHRITMPVREPATSVRFDPLAKVANQIPEILNNTPAHLLGLMCALLGVTKSRQARLPSSQARRRSEKDQAEHTGAGNAGTRGDAIVSRASGHLTGISSPLISVGAGAQPGQGGLPNPTAVAQLVQPTGVRPAVAQSQPLNAARPSPSQAPLGNEQAQRAALVESPAEHPGERDTSHPGPSYQMMLPAPRRVVYDVVLPSIRDALPAHAQIDYLLPGTSAASKRETVSTHSPLGPQQQRQAPPSGDEVQSLPLPEQKQQHQHQPSQSQASEASFDTAGHSQSSRKESPRAESSTSEQGPREGQ